MYLPFGNVSEKNSRVLTADIPGAAVRPFSRFDCGDIVVKSLGEIMAVSGSMRILAGIGFHFVGKLSGPGPVSLSAEDKMGFAF